MSRARSWCFTLNNWKESDIEALKKADCEYLICGKEISPTTHTLHLQGYVQFTSRKRFTSALQWFKELGLTNKPHIEIAKGSPNVNIRYCSKEDETPLIIGTIPQQGKRNDIDKMKLAIDEGATVLDIWNEFPAMYLKYSNCIGQLIELVQTKSAMDFIRETHAESTLRPWQIAIKKRLLRQTDREVLWIWEKVGNTGKSFLAKHLMACCGAMYLSNGKTSDIAYAYCHEPLVVFDFSRSFEEYINYGVIESLKNGVLFSTKYQSKTKVFKPAKIIVFANFEPDTDKLSEDRWDVIHLITYLVQGVFT